MAYEQEATGCLKKKSRGPQQKKTNLLAVPETPAEVIKKEDNRKEVHLVTKIRLVQKERS